MSRPDRISVFVDLGRETVIAGTAHFTRSRAKLSTTLAYDPSWLSHPAAYPLDPNLPLVSGNQHVAGLPGAFSDGAPDRWGRNLLAKRERELARIEGRRRLELDDVDYLLGVSDFTRQGAVRFAEPGTGTFLGASANVPKLISLPKLLNAADAVTEDAGGMRAIEALLDAGTGSLGGARPKASVVGDDNWLAIAKFPHAEDDWNVMAWEATALDIAESAGIRTPARRIVTVSDRTVLVLTRFDRDTNGSRIGYTSAMTLLGLHDGDSGDYVDIAETLEDVASTATRDLHELFARVVLSVAIHNTDDHLRNHGLLRTVGGWELSPVFDVNPNPSLAASRQCSIAGATNVEDEIEGLKALAADCRLSQKEAQQVFDRVADATSTWRTIATKNGITTKEQRLFAEVLDERCEALRSEGRR